MEFTNQEYHLNHYIIKNQIDVGGFGQVYHCFDDRTGAHYAAKQIPISHCLQSQTDFKHFLDEIRIESTIYFPNIVQLKDIIRDQDTVFLIHEYCGGGTLRSYVDDNIKLTESEAAPLFADIMKAINYLHQQNIAHRDVTLNNILLTSDHCFAKLSDFGLSKTHLSGFDCTTPCGTPFYVSPEIISNENYDGKKADIWAAGISLYLMIFGHFPWITQAEASTQKFDEFVFEQIRAGHIEYPSDVEISPELMELFECMFLPEELRFTADDVLDHEWVRMYSQNRPYPPYSPPNSQLQNLASGIVDELQYFRPFIRQ